MNRQIQETMAMLRDAGLDPLLEHGRKHDKIKWIDANGQAKMFIFSRGTASRDPRAVRNNRVRIRALAK